MPAPAAPKKKPELPPNMVLVSGTQEQFQARAEALCSALGWSGEPEWETNGITVGDAWNYVVKSLHEAFQAAAKGEGMPDPASAILHLGLESQDEQEKFVAALTEAYDEGKDADTSAVAKTVATTGAELVLPLGDAKKKAGK